MKRWDAKDKALLLVSHTTRLIYADPVVEAHSEVRKTPVDTGLQRVVTQKLEVEPAANREITHGVDLGLEAEAFLEALRELGATFQVRFRYDPDATDVHSSPKVLFEAGGGVCQDLTHAMIGVLRLAGVPCRYVSGYVYDPVGDDEGDHVQGSAASHAWVQIWHPDLGWVGIDPTNDKLVDWQYVRVAAGRDYTDVQPLRGVFVGPQDQGLDVEVAVKRIG